MTARLDYAYGIGATLRQKTESATVDRLKLQRMMTAHGREHSTLMQEWQNLSKPIRDSFGWQGDVQNHHRQSVPIIVALWFGARLKEQHRGDQWAEAMYALWVCVRADGPSVWSKKELNYRPVFSFAEKTVAILKVRSSCPPPMPVHVG